MALTYPEQQAAIAAVGRGEAQQIRIPLDDLFARVSELEKAAGITEGGKPSVDLKDVEAVEPPADDAKSVDVRESVIALTKAFNNLRSALKGDANG